MKYMVFFLIFISIPVFGQKKWVYSYSLKHLLQSNQVEEFVKSESLSPAIYPCFQIDTIKLQCDFIVFTIDVLKNKGIDIWEKDVKPNLLAQTEDSLSKVSSKFSRKTKLPFNLLHKTFDCSQKTEYLLISFTNYSKDLSIVARVRMINKKVTDIQGRDLFMYIEFDKRKRIKKTLLAQVFND